MDEVVRDLDFVYNYKDDIFVASASPEEHATHLRQLFERFQQYQVRINPDKCVFGASSLVFLGHNISRKGISPLREKAKALEDLQPPTSLRQLQHFLDLLNYYRHLIPHCADLLSFQLLHHRKKKNEQTSQDTSELKAFKVAKQKLAKTSLLAHPTPGAQFSLVVDASGTGCRHSVATATTTATSCMLFETAETGWTALQNIRPWTSDYIPRSETLSTFTRGSPICDLYRSSSAYVGAAF